MLGQVLSEGRSMLPADFQLTVKPEADNSASLVDAKFRNIGSLLNQDLLARYVAVILSTMSVAIMSNVCLNKNFRAFYFRRSSKMCLLSNILLLGPKLGHRDFCLYETKKVPAS
jgi:hypothetical protein